MAATAEELYRQREQRFNDIVALKKPDRIPVIPLVAHYFPTKIKGISNGDAGYDHELRLGSLREATVEFGWDMMPASAILGSDGYQALGSRQIRSAGRRPAGRRLFPVRRGRVSAGGGVRSVPSRPQRRHE